MKALKKIALIVSVIVCSWQGTHAQYYQVISQATDMISTALRGGQNYRGMIDAAYLNGFGGKNASFVELSTTQGIKYGSLFYMGIGAGVDYMFSQVNEGAYVPTNTNYTTKAWMVPVFTDFRLNFGAPSNTGFFIDLKVGAAFYISNRYIQVGDGYVNSGQSFLLRPAIGLRIPVSKSSTKHAINISATYQLLTNSYWYNPNGSQSCTLNALGFVLGYEW